MNAPVLLSDARDGILTLTLNRPSKRNALSSEMIERLHAELERAECLVLTAPTGGVSGLTNTVSGTIPVGTNPAAFGPTAMNAVTGVGAPS